MLVAYLRGLLKPDYPNGTRSIIRENIVLQALARELEASEIITRASMESSYSALLQHDQANKLLKHHDKMLSLAFNHLKHKVETGNKYNVNMSEINRLLAAYAAMQKGGLLKPQPD